MAKYFKERGNKLFRFLDRYAGIPLVAAAGLIRSRSAAIPATINRIGILKTAAIGDTILLDAVSKDLRKTWPKAQQIFFAARDNYQVAGMLADIDEVIVLPMSKPWAAAIRIYAAGRFDLWLDFGPWARINALLTQVARAACKIGFMTPRQYRHYGYDFRVEHRQDVHELENYRNLVRVAGVTPEALPLLKGNSRKGTILGFSPQGPYVVLHMFPGGTKAYMKEWPRERWLELAQFLLGKGWAVAFTGGPGDVPRAQAIIDDLGGNKQVHNLAGRIPLPQLPAVLAGSTLVISVNTGVMHLAAAVGARLIALHGPTSPERWGPLSQHAEVIRPQNLSCSPCLHLGFEYKCEANNCLQNIPAQVVINAIDRDIIPGYPPGLPTECRTFLATAV